MQIEIRGAEKLSFREKQVVVLKESGLNADAIAKKLGIAQSSVATLYQRARAKGYETVIILPGSELQIPKDEGEVDDHEI